MTDRKALPDPNEPPEDVASLYSWANLHGAKYRDFSISRAQSRERTRVRVQQAIEEEQERARREAEAQHAEELRRAEEQARRSELAAQVAAQQAAQQAAQMAAQQAAQQAAQEMARLAAQEAAQEARAAQAQAAQYAQSAQQAAQQAAWQQQQRADRFAAPYLPPAPAYPGYAPAPPQPLRPPAPSPQHTPMHEESPAFFNPPQWIQPEAKEPSVRPAWLAERPEMAAPSGFPAALPQTPGDTIQGSRDRVTARWFALKGLFDSSPPPADVAPAPALSTSRAPVLAVFSLAGGVGKTSLVATLGRALSARGERVLLVDTAAFGLLPFFFGARDQRPGQLRTFSPPAASGDAPIQMVAVDPEGLGPENGGPDALTNEIAKYSRGISRVLIDLATASGATTRRILKLSPLVLVPVIPDMNSVVSVSSIDAFFERNTGASGNASLPYYVLNQFDPSLPLHLDVREVLREQLGERLLAFALRRAPAVSEALAEGMTVMDYAPNSAVTEDYASLAGWVKSLSAPASTSFRGVRWSER